MKFLNKFIEGEITTSAERFFLLLFSLFSLLGSVRAQPDSLYDSLLAKGGLLYLQKDYKNAIVTYEKAWKIKQLDALSAYSLAGAYALDSNVEKSLFYLRVTLQKGWTEADRLLQDDYFNFVRESVPRKWEEIKKQAFSLEKKYEARLRSPALRKRINLIARTDQQLRYKRVQASDKNERGHLDHEIQEADSIHLVQAKKIFESYGWPKLSEIGSDGQNNLWLIIQHADQDVLFQKLVLLAMAKLIKANEVNLEHYAFLYDRVQCNLNLKQLYGTQVNWANHGEASGFRSIIDEDHVDERRATLGLVPLGIYALSYGFSYKQPTLSQADEKDSIDLVYTKHLIDSGNYFYTKGNFSKTYDYYNVASTVLGGMTSADNFDAAVLFSKISIQLPEQQYKDIAIDFLILLRLRQELTKRQLNEQPEFKVLYREQRWTTLYKLLK